MKRLCLLIVSIFLLQAFIWGQTKKQTIFPGFEEVLPSISGVSFENKLLANMATKENLFDYDFFYNGSGVGLADINNDDLLDIFFTANQVENRLYLNKGDLQFEDITKSANINKGKNWSSGVSFADVNGDGWIDIYVCQGGPFPGDQRKNLLFINQKNNTFSEEAEAYGIADMGISTQACFFDYDKDGDLDCIVANENELYGIDPVRFYRTLNDRPDLLHKSSSHLYKNDNGHFTDVTKEAGVLKATFGLGLTVGDINGDSWPDIYIANDYYVPDIMFINKKDGTFKDEVKSRTDQMSFYGMGVDMADIDNDGLQDIYVLDMASNDHFRAKTLMASMNVANFRLLVDGLKMPYQYMFNSLQVNKGNGSFDNIAHLGKIAKTDWSWAGLIADFDNDGLKDIFVTNGYRRYALDNDLKQRVTDAQIKYQGKVPLEVKKELYYDMPTEKLPNILFHNQGGWQFKDVAASTGLEKPTYSNGAAFADLDQDGDLDIVINNIDEKALIYRNLSSDRKAANYLRVKLIGKQSEHFAKVYLYYAQQVQLGESKRVRGYLSSVENVVHFGLGAIKKIDSLKVVWPDGRFNLIKKLKVNRQIEIDQANAKTKGVNFESKTGRRLEEVSAGKLKLLFKHKENTYNDFEKEILLPYKQSSFGPSIAKGDFNGDGNTDIFVGGAFGQAGALFEQTDKGFKRLKVPALERDSSHEDQGGCFVDYDGDGDQDLLVLSGGNSLSPNWSYYRNRLYRNDAGSWVNRTEDLGDKGLFQSNSVASLDYDKDGDLDLIIANRIIPQSYPKAAPSTLLRNEGGVFSDQTEVFFPELSEIGIINKVLATDFNQDGWTDVLLIGEWTGIHFFQNNKGRFEKLDNPTLNNTKGWWFNAVETDVNKDGKPDYIVGNLGLNSKFSASQEKPFKVYANDFDGTGSLDIVLSKEYQGKEVPVRGRECSSQQMPFIKEKFPTFKEFATASLDDIYGEKLDKAIALEANDFHSVILINEGGNNFKIQYLPVEAQTFPMLSIVVEDLNSDGFEDLVVGGTIYDTEVETPRWDAGSGLILFSNQKDNYTVALPEQALNNIKGDIKSMTLLPHKALKEKFLIIGKNNALLSILKLAKN